MQILLDRATLDYILVNHNDCLVWLIDNCNGSIWCLGGRAFYL